MLPVGKRLVIQHVLDECAAAGLDQVLAVINRRKLALLDALDVEDSPLDEQQMPRRLVYLTLQRVQGGLGHAVLHAEGFASGESFAVALPDTLLTGGADPALARLVRLHQERGAAATIAVEEVAAERVSRYGILAPVGDQHSGDLPSPSDVFRVASVVEKPAPHAAPSRLAISARYVFSPSI